MRLRNFLNYIWLTDICPDRINPARWKAMLKWYETREKCGESLDY